MAIKKQEEVEVTVSETAEVVYVVDAEDGGDELSELDLEQVSGGSGLGIIPRPANSNC